MFQDYFSYGGIEKVILDIKNNACDYDIDILSMVNKSKEKVTSLFKNNYCNFFIRNILGLSKFKKYLYNNEYDIIHIHCYNSFGLIYAFIARKYIKHVIIHAHNSDIDNDFLYIKHLLNSIIKFLFKSRNYTYLAVNEECNKFCFNNKNTIILRNCIDYSKYLFNENERKKYQKMFGVKKGEIVIGHVGRFEKQKNHKFLIDIFNEINKIKNNYKLVLVGDGSQKNEVINKIHQLKLEKKIIILNNRDDIFKLINMFDIFLFPSIVEGFPLSIVENQVNGKYVFASDILDKNIIISNRINFISLKKNAYYWASKIINLKENNFKLDKKLDIINYISKLKKIYRGFNEKNT